MKKTRFTEEQMVSILREADQRPVPEIAKKHGVSAQTIYGWRKHFGTYRLWRHAGLQVPKRRPRRRVANSLSSSAD